MPNIKTAISMQKSLFEEVDVLAKKMDISRSRLFVLAVEDFIKRYQNRQLLKAINDAHDDASDSDVSNSDVPVSEEQELRYQVRQQHRKMAEGEW